MLSAIGVDAIENSERHTTRDKTQKELNLPNPLSEIELKKRCLA